MPDSLPGDEIGDARSFRFGEFELDAQAHRLARLGRRVAIQLKPFEFLVYLIEHRDRVVSRAELLAEVWRGVHVDEAAVRFALHSLRRAVGDDGNRQAVIRTVPGVGFQFVAPVVPLETSKEAGRGERTEANPRATVRPPFLGRSRLMSDSAELLGQAARGEGGVLMLCGEAGVGKTRSLEQLAELAEARGFRVLHGRCVESEGAPAFWPWIQILRSALGADPPHSLLRALAESAPEVAWMVPELRPLIPDAPQMRTLDAQAARFLLFDGLTTFLEGLAADRPHLLCIDDLHRADTASLALLLHVARELGRPAETHLALAGAYRDMDLRATPALADLLVAAAALPHARQETLRGLEVADVAALVHSLSGRVPSQAVVDELHQKTNGNPFFLHQILRVLESESRLPELESARSIDLELPRHVQDAICHQVRLLPDRARELIELASVAGREFTVADLESAVGLERGEVLSLLGQAIEAGVVGEHGSETGRFRFVHALVGDAISARLPLEVRARHHACIARAIEVRCGEQPSADSAALAHHYSHSSRHGDVERAVRSCEMAAQWCSARGAFENAPAHLERALALLATTGAPAEADRCRLLLCLGEALTNAGMRERAREVLQTAAEIAQQQGFRDELAMAALRFAPDFLAIETGVYDPELVRLLEAALASLGESPTPVRARLLARLAIALQWNRAEDARGRALCDEAAAIATGADPETRQTVSIAESLINFSLVEPGHQLLRVPTVRGSNASLELLQRLLTITSLMLLGRVREADSEITLFADLATESRHPQARWYVDLMRSTRALMEGRYEEAAGLATRYLALGTRFGDRNAIQSYGVQTLMSSFDTGGPEAHESPLRQLVALFPGMIGWHSGLALFLTEVGRYDEARDELRRLVVQGGLELARPNEWYAVHAALALASGELGDSDIAVKLYPVLLPYASGMTVVGYCSYSLGSTQRLLGVLAATLGEWDLARAHFEAAISTNAANGAVACNGRVYLEYAQMLFARGDLQAGRHRAMQAMEIASRFGMQRLSSRIEARIPASA